MIRRSYSPPFQTRAPQLGVDEFGRAVKSLVSVEVNRTNEVSFAVESFGCDGKPVLSLLRGLSCETPGALTMAGTKNGMPFKLGGDLPRGAGSAIRGAGGGLVSVATGISYGSSERVLFDNYGNHWSLDRGTTPVYLGETPPDANGDGLTPAYCAMAPIIRPYWKILQYFSGAGGGEGGPGDDRIHYFLGGAGWCEDSISSPIIISPPFSPPHLINPATYWYVKQWLPDETTAPDGTGVCGAWSDTVQHVDVEWFSVAGDKPHDYDGVVDGGIGDIVSMYAAIAPWTIYLNRWTRPLVEHISIGGIADEEGFLIGVEENKSVSPTRRISLRHRGTGVYIGTPASYPALPARRTDGRHFFTPYHGEGWLFQTGVVASSHVVMAKFRSRTSTSNAYGSAVAQNGTITATLPAGAAHAWDAEPVWFRCGTVTRSLGGTGRTWPLLPRWS